MRNTLDRETNPVDESWLEMRRPAHGFMHPATKRQLRDALSSVEGLRAIAMKEPEASGRGVLVRAHLNRDLVPKLYVYAIPTDALSGSRLSDFEREELPAIRDWLSAELGKSETALFEPVEYSVRFDAGRFVREASVMRGRPYP